jgi:MoaA/NifB/PqqE/SkfB family radical SAM enzyme
MRVLLRKIFVNDKAKVFIEKYLHFNIDYIVEYISSISRKNSLRLINDGSLEHRNHLMRALFKTILERIEQGLISENFLRKILRYRVAPSSFVETKRIKQNYIRKYNRLPPGFVLISPTKRCNLQCIGCYYDSDQKSGDLEYGILQRIIHEAYSLWASRSIAISGGEPFLYSSHGKNIIDLAEEFPHMFFGVFTNGSYIDNKIAKKIARLGNLSPMISLEGYEEQTDKRRGIGVYKKVMHAFENLRNYGVLYGVSITATRENIEILTTPEYYDFLFDDIKVTFGWIFEYMPIGRGKSIDLMPTPEQRKLLFEVLDIQNQNGRFICDFWSAAPASEGCFSAGRDAGYIHINSNGAVSPCAFNPYSDTNIKDIYREGGNLNDAINNSKLFQLIRQWQDTYGFQKGNDAGNYITPCLIRDHYKEYRKILDSTEAIPIDKNAAEALNDSLYYKRLVDYGEKLKEVLDPVWRNRFCRNCGTGSATQ